MVTFWFVLALTLVLAVAVSSAWSKRSLAVTADIALVSTAVDLDHLLFTRLAAVKGIAMVDAEHGRFTLATRRIPGWAGVAAVLTFPVGLVFLLVRSDRLLNLSLVSNEHGQALRITGTVEAHVWRRVSRALAPLVADEQPALDALVAPR